MFEDDSSAAYGFGDTIINLLQVSAAHELPWGLRTASFTDPAGHVWEIVHSLSGQSPGNE